MKALVLSQVVLSFALPLAIIPMLIISRHHELVDVLPIKNETI
jgi:Mn2+/Fe2+ NRAMP family transporter